MSVKELWRKLTSKMGRKYTIEDNIKDSTPSAVQKLNIILNYLNSLTNKVVSYDEIAIALEKENVTKADVIRGIQKSLKDGYVLEMIGKSDAFYISYEGIKFAKNGGYISYRYWQLWKDKDLFDKIHKLATIIVAIFAVCFAYQNLNLKPRVSKLEENISSIQKQQYHLNNIKPQEPPNVNNTITLPDTLLLHIRTKIKVGK